MTYKVCALARILCPKTNIPATTALATINREQGRELGLSRGANIIMPNVTPLKYRQMYEIYPGKACVYETAEACNACIMQRIENIGRTIGGGKGTSPKFAEKMGSK
jgi:biotin synthase